MTRPLFVTFEGGEGAGKTTQIERLAAKLGERGISVTATREPGGSPGAEEIRKLLVTGEPGRWDSLTETLLMFAARADHLTKTIKPALEQGRLVLCDRFTDSTYAYQGAGRGIPRETLRRIESVVLGTFKPDFTLILDLPVEEGLARAAARSGNETRFENFDRGFHERLRKAFLDIAKRNPDRCVMIDAAQPMDAVTAAIWEAMSKRCGF